NKAMLIQQANAEVAQGLVRRGGGVEDLTLRTIDRGDGSEMAVIHVYANTCDAMGANIMNQICEFLKGPIEQKSGERVGMCILSKLVDTRTVRAEVRLQGLDEGLGRRIEEASLFAELDSYRAATNNKGVLNGIDPILIATGNDWRAVEAGLHAYAAQGGQYRAVTQWTYDAETAKLRGVFKAPEIGRAHV